MASRRKFRVDQFAAAMIAVSLPLSLTMAAGLPIGDEPANQNSTMDAVAKARQLLGRNQPVAARALLLKSLEAKGSDQDPARDEALNLLAEASKAIRTSDPLEVSLQKARLALEEGDIRSAERQTQAVIKSATVSPEQATSAEMLLKSVEARRAELAAVVPTALEQARRDFDEGRYAQAKSGLQMVDRSGVKLSAEQQGVLDSYQLKLVAMGEERPGLFGPAADAGMFQPATVKRRDEAQPPASNPPAAQTPPAAPAPATKPAEKPAAPAAQPATQPAKPAPAPVDDPLAQSKKLEIDSQLKQADAAFKEGKYDLASKRYGILQSSDYKKYMTAEQVTLVESRLAESKVRAGGQPVAPTQDELIRERQVRHDRTVAEFNNDIAEANKLLKSGSFKDATIAGARARLVLNSNREVFPEAEFENMTKTVNDTLANVAKAEIEAQRRDQEVRTRESADAAKKAEKEARQERERKIVELIDRARAHQSEMRYTEALQDIDQLLFLDPINPTGLLLRDVYQDIILYRRNAESYDKKALGYAINSMDNRDAAIPPAGLVNYPSDWPAISTRRGEPVQFAETPENRAVLGAVSSKRIPTVAFNDNALKDVVEFVKTVMAPVNVDADWTSLEAANIQQDATVSLNLTNVTVKSLLDRIVEKISGSDKSSRADWAVLDGVLTIASEEKIRKRTELVIYDVRDLLIDVPDYRDVPRIDLQQALQASQGGGGGGGGQSPFRNENEREDQQQRQRDRDQKLDDLINIIRDNVDNEGWTENGGDTGKITKVGTGNLIITNTPKNHRQIAGLLSKLRDIRALQINVETRFLLVNQDFFEQIGFDLDVYLNTNNNQVRVARGNDRSIQGSDFFNFSGSGNKVGLQRTVTGQVAPNGPVTGNPNGTQISQAFVNPRAWSPVAFSQDSLGLSTAIAPRSDWSDTILGASPALGIAGQFLDDIQVDFLIQATQADRRSIQLTAPRLTFTNGQAANIYVATQTAFVSDLNPVVGDSAVGFDPTVSVVTEGVTLLVEGTVSADRRYVTLNVDAGIARVDGFAQQAVSAVAGGQLVSSAATQSFIQLPQVTVTRVRTTVTVPDQGTILLGGQRLTTEYEIETGVPVLSKIPIINRFFTNRLESKEEQTLLILLKPTVLIQNEEEERNFPGLLDAVRSGMGG